jgi:acyl carrier protein
MELTQILKEVNEIFIDVLDNDKIVVKESTTANDVEEWDSLTHIQLVVAIEKHFKLRFTAAEIQKWKNVGEMCNAIQKGLVLKER